MHITSNCGLLEEIQHRDAVMADKGFIHIKTNLDFKKGAKLSIIFKKPKTNSQKKKYKYQTNRFSENPHGKNMEQIKKFKLLQGIIPLTLAPIANE